MFLTLIPPSSYPIPPVLQIHSFPPPNSTKTKVHSKTTAFFRANKTLEQVGIKLPCFLAGDKTNWWSLAVKEVTWNLEKDEIEVEFVDGSSERWDFDEPLRDEEVIKKYYPSEEFIIDDLPLVDLVEDDSKIEISNSSKEIEIEKSKRVNKQSILDQLVSLSMNLRSAFEDLGITHPYSFGLEDFSKIMELSEKPNLPFPTEWLDSSPDTEANSTDEESALEEIESQKEEERRSQSAATLLSPPTSPKPNSDYDQDPCFPSAGQLTNVRRPTSLPTSAQYNKANPPHDICSFVHLLTTTRQTLINLFSSSIIPILKKRLPPTYPMWAASNAIKSLRKRAVQKGAKVGKLVLDVLDDDGESFDVSSEEEEEEEEDEEGSEGDEDDLFEAGRIFWTSSGKRKETIEEKKDRRLQKNFLLGVVDDLSLRVWCERTISRGELSIRNNKERIEPNWIGKIPHWDVARPLPPSLVLKLGKKSTNNIKKKTSISKPVVALSESLLDTIVSNNSNNKKNQKFPYSSDEDTDEDDSPGTIQQQDLVTYFYPQNTLNEDLLPPRLPRTLLEGDEPGVGKELSSMKHLIKASFDTIAGYQKKMVELKKFVDVNYSAWEAVQNEFAIDAPSPKPKITGRPLKSIANDGTLLPSMQPLRYLTADATLASNLKDSKRKASTSTLPRSFNKITTPISPVRPATPTPPARRRQKANLAILDSVLDTGNNTDNNKIEGGRKIVLVGAITGKKRRRSREILEDVSASTSSSENKKVKLEPALDLPSTSNESETQVLRLSPQDLSKRRKKVDSSDLEMDWKSFDEKELDADSGDLLVQPSYNSDNDSIFEEEETEEEQIARSSEEDFARQFSRIEELMDIDDEESDDDSVVSILALDDDIESILSPSNPLTTSPQSVDQKSTTSNPLILPTISTISTLPSLPPQSPLSIIPLQTSDPQNYSLESPHFNSTILSPTPIRPSTIQADTIGSLAVQADELYLNESKVSSDMENE